MATSATRPSPTCSHGSGSSPTMLGAEPTRPWTCSRRSLPETAEVAVCLTCLGVKSNHHYECRERTGSFRAMTVTRQDTLYAVNDYLHPIKRTEIVVCTENDLSWTVSQYAGQGADRVTLYSIPFTDVLGAEVRGHKRDVVDVWIDDGPTVTIHTRPREADALGEYIERTATSA